MSSDELMSWPKAVRRALAVELSRLHGEWREEGDYLLGPGTLEVKAADLHDAGPGHIDIGFVLNRNRKDVPVIWDCVAGGEGDLEDAAQLACHIWAQTTAPTVFEFLKNKGELADHSDGDTSLGLKGWHSIHGPLLAYGRSDTNELRDWFLETPVVPILSEILEPALSPDTIHGVKFLVGSFGDRSIAEVRIDCQRNEACSRALLELLWPKNLTSVVRFFVLFVHPIPSL